MIPRWLFYASSTGKRIIGGKGLVAEEPIERPVQVLPARTAADGYLCTRATAKLRSESDLLNLHFLNRVEGNWPIACGDTAHPGEVALDASVGAYPVDQEHAGAGAQSVDDVCAFAR